MLNYSEGAQHCKLNSARLETSARIILKDEDGTDSFGLLLYYLSYEEIAKAIFCLFVDRKWVTEDFVDYVFKYHEAKIFLFEEIFRSLEIINGKGHLGGAPIGDVLLENFIELHKRVIKEHRRKTMDFVYVGKNNDWKVPSFSLSNIKELEKEIIHKIRALDTIFEFIDKRYDKNSLQIDGFRFTEDSKGNFTISYDSI